MKASVVAFPLVVLTLTLQLNAFAQDGDSSLSETNNPIARIRDEGMNHSQVMETLSTLTEVIGPRLTGSPNLKRANEWTRDQLKCFGLTNAHLEAWGPFGRGWSLKRFSAQIVEPQTILLAACPNAWSPGLEHSLTADVVFFDVKTNSDMQKYKGKLKGAIVLASPLREVKAHFEPPARRMVETNLLRLANAGPSRSFNQTPAGSTNGGRFRFAGASRRSESNGSTNNSATTTNATGSSPLPENRGQFRGRSDGQLAFLANEGAALVVTASSQGDGGTLF